MNNLVSIIVPVYDVDSFVSSCLESIHNQTYSKIEIIVVVDTLWENSVKICNYYKKEDKRIKMIEMSDDIFKNYKNIGLEHAKGKYIAFVDGGDTIAPNYIEYMVNLLETEEVDFVSTKVFTKEQKHKKSLYYEIYEKDEIIKEYMHMGFKSTVFGKLFRKEIFDDIKFPDIPHFDSFTIGYRLFDKAKKMVNSEAEIYLLNTRKNAYDIKDYDRMKKIGACFDMLTYIEEFYPGLISNCKTKLCFEAIDLFRNVKDKDYRKQLFSYIKLYRKYALRNKNISVSQKMLCMRSILGYHLMKISFDLEEFIKKPV